MIACSVRKLASSCGLTSSNREVVTAVAAMEEFAWSM